MSWNWKQLEAEEAFAFLDAVREQNNSILFEPSLCEVYRHDLPFYDGYDLIRIVNQYSPPFILLDYLSNGENHFYLDGSDHALQTICARGSTSLDSDNVLQYLDLYLSYVYERGNSLVYIRDPRDTGHKGSDAMGLHFKAIQQHQGAKTQWNEDKQAFEVKTPLLYQEKSVESVIYVSKQGQISVEAPLKVSFLDNPHGYEEIALIHPKAESIIEQCKTLLSKTKSGQRLLTLAEKKNIEIRVIGSPDIRAIATNKPLVYLFMPAAQYTADYHQALVLAGALRDAEQILMAYPRPSLEEKPEIYFSANYDKNLNMLGEICKIVDEYDVQNIHDAVSAMRRLGIEDIYTGYKSGASPEKMMEIYIKMMTKQGFIVEGA